MLASVLYEYIAKLIDDLEASLTNASTKSLVLSKMGMRVSGNDGEITDSQIYNRIVRLTPSSRLAIMSNEYGGVTNIK